MAIDSRDKRASVIGHGLASLTVWPNPDGTLNAADRLHMAWLYRGIAATTPTGMYPYYYYIAAQDNDEKDGY